MPTLPSLSIEFAGQKDLGPCACCGNPTRRVWGYAHRGPATEAAYFIEWSPGKIAQHGANFDLILGPWGEGATRQDRVAVSLRFRQTAEGPQFMVVDAVDRPTAKSDLVGPVLTRDAVLGTPLAGAAFEIVDAIWLQDSRIRELLGDAG